MSTTLSYGEGLKNLSLPFGINTDVLNVVPEWIFRLAGFAFFGVIGYFLIELNNVYAIIRTRATVQTSFFFLLVASCPELHTAYTSILTTIPLVLSVFMLFRSYHVYSDAPGIIFYSFLLLALSSMLSPKVIWFAPLWFITMANFRSLTIRSIFAAIIGAALPYWFLFAHAAFYGRMELFTQPFTDMADLADIGPASLPSYGVNIITFMVLLFLGSLIQYATESYKDKLQVHSYIGFLLSLMAYGIALILIQPSLLNDLLTTLMISCALLTAHLFVMTTTKSSNIFFIIMMVGLAAIYILNLFHL
jgi:hypothetical protein